ncbi:MAG: type 2 isopentenyl-diphosphate Delta-isomerase [Candidatus Aenigmarchaeota archaeon ex4484_52]|nr:MAG: type 2 isopentenyl-diphosphate Delta-isomerase [Candidatus Aenigmarchaeota archaeon ex4484_52]
MEYSSIEKRKQEHIELCLNKNIQTKNTSLYEDIVLLHRAIPNIDKNKIDLTVDFLGKKINYPFVIEAMTGGCKLANTINKNLAIAAQVLNIPVCVGSQRAMLEDKKQTNSFELKKFAPKIPFLISNIGLVQFCQNQYKTEDINKITNSINADALCIHLNAAQEALQKNGDVNFENGFEILKKIANNSFVPIIVKETGCGIIKEDAYKLAKLSNNISMIDIAGNCGTSFTHIEALRRKDNFGLIFKKWGIPTTISTIECSSCGIPLIASGGVRDGIQCAKLLRLGSDYLGFALPLLKPSLQSPDAVIEKIKKIAEELKITMFLCGAKNIKDFKKTPVVILGKTKNWINNRVKN